MGKENTVKTFSKISKVYWDFGGKTRGDEEVLLDFKDGKFCLQDFFMSNLIAGSLSRFVDGNNDNKRIKAKLGSEESVSKVQMVRISEFINKVVATRRWALIRGGI